jgi:uncharacterized LabA/DUF88 family protein
MLKERAIVFVDGNNLHNGLKDCYGIERLDLLPFCRHIVQNRELEAIYYADANFISEFGHDNYARQQAYFSYIRKIKELVFCEGYYNKMTKPPTEKLADVYLATSMVDLCHLNKFDMAYLVAGDSDYVPAVDVLIRMNKRVMNVYFDTIKRNSYNLRKHCRGLFKNITRSIAEGYKWEYK